MVDTTEKITLSADQEAAVDAFIGFLADPKESVFVIEGYAGTGKTTLIKDLLRNLSKHTSMLRLIDPDYKELTVRLTATTHKAAEELSIATGETVDTIHSVLQLRVVTDYETRRSTLIPKNNCIPIVDSLIFIDESSYVDSQLLDYIFKLTINCKIVFMGDRAQLAPIGCTKPPVFEAGFKGVMLTKVVRQSEGNPIIEMATCFRNTVLTGEWTPFNIDGDVIRHFKDRDDFNNEILKEFVRPDWTFKQSKILGWTNKCVQRYNAALANHSMGRAHFIRGDYALNNSYVMNKHGMIKTDEMVLITEVFPDEQVYGVSGNWLAIDHRGKFFLPHRLEDKLARVKQARKEDDMTIIGAIDREWIDLRHSFAETLNKSQGSTYGKVFIDLDDIRRCNSGDQIARMLYVGPSRAKQNVYLVGDF